MGELYDTPDNTGSAESKELSGKAKAAILRIAYLIAAADGAVKDSEKDAFKKALAALNDFKMGSDEMTALIEKIVEDAQKLVILRDFYDDEAMIQAFLSKVSPDIVTIQSSKISARAAFAVWTSICIADKDFSPFERKLIRALQVACNGISGLSKGLIGGAVALGILGGPIFGAAAAIAGIAAGKQLGKAKEESGFGPDSRVPDAFLSDVENRCREIDDAQSQLEKATTPDEKRAVEDSLKFLVESFTEFIFKS